MRAPVFPSIDDIYCIYAISVRRLASFAASAAVCAAVCAAVSAAVAVLVRVRYSYKILNDLTGVMEIKVCQSLPSNF